MRIAIVADIHGNLPALEAVVKDINRRGVDAIVNLGDSVSGPLLPRETARFLIAQDWTHIAGNHEREMLTQGRGQRGASDEYAHSQLTSEEFDWMASLKPNAAFSREVFLCHGTPTSDAEYLLETVEPTHVRAATLVEVDARLGKVDAEVIVCGHTHVPRSVRSSAGQLIVNPGSVGLPAYDDIYPHPHVIETGSPDARYAIIDHIAETWVVELIAVPYAHEAMARLALARGRQDWACALSSGYMS
jgi:putative phosphoesterase